MPPPELRVRRGPRTADGAPSVWTDETIETLKSLWAEGLSAAQVASRLGVTRNAVIGKVHRLGLAARPPRPRSPRPARPLAVRAGPQARSPRSRTAAEPSLAAILREVEDLQGEATLMTLGANMCRWPIGDPQLDAFRLCGRAADGGPYCAHHARLAYVSPRARSASTARLMSSLRRVL